MKEKRFNAADYLGTGLVDNVRYCAWYRDFDREKFERLFDAAIADGAPFGYVIDSRVDGQLVPAVNFCGYDDFKIRADLRNPDERANFMRFCDRRIPYLETLTGKRIRKIGDKK